jgi:hypothetical protein
MLTPGGRAHDRERQAHMCVSCRVPQVRNSNPISLYALFEMSR